MKDQVIETIEQVLKSLSVTIESVEKIETELGHPCYMIKTPESGVLIGHKGEHINALTHVVRRIVSKKNGDEEQKFSLDVNDYRVRTMEQLKQRVTILAERARSFKTSVELEPMSSYERMIVHSVFSETPDITTESAGFGRDRHVVIKYAPKEE
jgi:spoIIIJ-associated protein